MTKTKSKSKVPKELMEDTIISIGLAQVKLIEELKDVKKEFTSVKDSVQDLQDSVNDIDEDVESIEEKFEVATNVNNEYIIAQIERWNQKEKEQNKKETIHSIVSLGVMILTFIGSWFLSTFIFIVNKVDIETSGILGLLPAFLLMVLLFIYFEKRNNE